MNITEVIELDGAKYGLYKENPTDKIWWLYPIEPAFEDPMFTFNKKEIFSVIRDYPYALTSEQKEIFDKENPFWKEELKHRLT